MYDWAHVYSSFRGQWLPGDRRGFNNRDHRIHSSRCYLIHDPSTTEHAGLEHHARELLKRHVVVGFEFMPLILRALQEKFARMDVPVAAIACHFTHAHALIKVGKEDAKQVFGRAKQFASHALRKGMPGRIWGESSGVRRIRGFKHFASVLWYIMDHERQGASVWCDQEMEALCKKRFPTLRVANPYAVEWTKGDPS